MDYCLVLLAWPFLHGSVVVTKKPTACMRLCASLVLRNSPPQVAMQGRIPGPLFLSQKLPPSCPHTELAADLGEGALRQHTLHSLLQEGGLPARSGQLLRRRTTLGRPALQADSASEAVQPRAKSAFS